MPNRKLLEVTRVLAPDQVKRLRLFTASPYFNSGYNAAQLIDLLDRVLAANSEEAHPDLDKATLSKQYFPGKPFRENAKNPIDSLSSDLFRLVRRFLLHEDAAPELGQDREHLALARFYQRHSLEERFWQTIEAFRKTLDAQTVPDGRHYLMTFYLEAEVASFESRFNSYTSDANLRAAHQNLDVFYAALKLDLACALEYQHQLGPIEPAAEQQLARMLLDALPDLPYLHTPLVELYQLVMTLLENIENNQAFTALEEGLRQHREAIPPFNYRNLQAYYRSFAGRRYLRAGTPDIYHRLFDLYREHLCEGYFYDEDKLLPASLKLLVNIALRTGNAAWAEEFLQAHGPDRIIGTRFPVEWHRLNQAEVAFFQKKYAAAADLLVYKHFENVQFSILADVLLVKIYYETRDDLLESRIRALEMKVRRAKLSEEKKAQYLAFIAILNKVIKYALPSQAAKRQKLREDIAAVPGTLEREWLLGILDRMRL